MKNLLTLFCLVFVTAIGAQNADFAGIYILKVEGDSGVTQHKIALHEEGTFLFSSFFSPKEVDGKILEIRSLYGSGKWRANGNQLFFVVNKEEDFDKDRILDFSNTKARIDSSSLESTNGKNSSLELVFYDSNLSWLKGLKLPRQ